MAAFTFLWPERSSPSAAPQEPVDGGGVETGRGGGCRENDLPPWREEREREQTDDGRLLRRSDDRSSFCYVWLLDVGAFSR